MAPNERTEITIEELWAVLVELGEALHDTIVDAQALPTSTKLDQVADAAMQVAHVAKAAACITRLQGASGPER